MDFIEFSTSHFPSMTPDSENPRVTDTGKTENFPKKNRNRPFNPENREFSDGWYSRGKCWNSATNDVKMKKQNGVSIWKEGKKMVDHLRNFGEWIFTRKSFIIKEL